VTPPRLGTITIGQAPRPDVTPVLDAHVPFGVARLHVGVLDGLSDEEICTRFAPRPGAHRLVTRLADGCAVELDAAAVEAGVQAKLEALEQAGCTVVLVLCTGIFHSLKARRAWLLEPDRFLPPLVAGLAGSRRVGVMLPLAAQAEGERSKWSRLSVPPCLAAATPYTDAEDHVSAAARQLQDAGAAIIVMDCIGYTVRHRRAAVRATGLPVLLSNDLVARVAAACFPED
jgi:protein AroM